ncbi:MAG TPA: MarR family transcriptional regulator [Streptosporangiaceae bacterium]|jgi:DNA-binding MarR family transcriptional regulator|nr:MarR family transcriptional regulator [Streptosporangiaceae bacterium]
MTSQSEQPDQYACAAAWAALSAAHAMVTEQLSAALAGSCGLSINEFEVLLRVSRAAGPGLRQGLLRSAVRLTQPSLSRAVARLERHGWLRRSGAPGDGRGVLVAITPAGREVLGRAAALHAGIIRTLLLDQLDPDEQELLARALTRVAERGPGAHPEPEQPWPSQPHSA